MRPWNSIKNAGESGHTFDAVILDLTIPGGKGGKKTIKELLAFDGGEGHRLQRLFK